MRLEQAYPTNSGDTVEVQMKLDELTDLKQVLEGSNPDTLSTDLQEKRESLIDGLSRVAVQGQRSIDTQNDNMVGRHSWDQEPLKPGFVTRLRGIIRAL